MAVPSQPGCLTRDALTAAPSATGRGRLCYKSGRLCNKSSRLCNKHGRRCNTDSRFPIDPLSNTCNPEQVVEFAIPQPNPSQINRHPAEGGGGGGRGATALWFFQRSRLQATGRRPPGCFSQNDSRMSATAAWANSRASRRVAAESSWM